MPHERQKYGGFGENLAVGYIVSKGYRIIETNYKNRLGEIDIIARDGDAIVFIEVKSRRSNKFGSARASVSLSKQRKISMVALGYLKSNGGTGQKARFDVVAINSPETGSEDHIELIQNAFDLAYG